MKRFFFRLARYAVPYWFQSLLGVVLLAVVGLLDPLRIALVGPILNQVLAPGTTTNSIPLLPRLPARWQVHLEHFSPPHFHNAWAVVAFALIASTVLKGICDYAGTYLVNYAGFGMITDLRNHLYETIMKSSSSFFHKHATGTILSTLINDVERVQTAVSSVLSDFLQQVFTFIFTLALVISYGGRLSWALLIFVPIVITSARKIGGSVRVRTRTGQDRVAEIQNILHETITGNRIVKAFSTELWEILRFQKAARRLFRANLRSVRIQSISSPLMDVIASIAIALLIWIGRNEIKAGRMDVGSFITFLILLFKLYDPVRKFAFFYNSFQQAMGASMSIFTFLDIEDDVPEGKHAHQLKGFHDKIAFENVGFAYSTEEGEHQILHDVDLEVRVGEMLALVGPSGAGKSTLVNLIPRFYDVSSGRILIDGHDLRTLTLDSLRKQIAQVTQETILFNDTVRNNIAYGQPDTAKHLVEEAAKHALAHEFILRMPQGYDTVIGEKGFRLSGGEKQRIAIARAILKNAPILILDEATSALDAESESLVQMALRNLMQGRTVVVIAHRLSTVRRANRTVVLEEGRITAIGSHDELLSSSATYQRLYELQFTDGPEKSPGCTGYHGGRPITPPMSTESNATSVSATASVSSMTGFARAAVDVDGQFSYSITLKSVNHRFLDLHLRMPSGLDALEMELRRVLKEQLTRGHVELILSVDRTASARAGYNRDLVAGYVETFKAAAQEFGLEGQPDLNVILRMPGVLQAEARSSDDDNAALAASVLQNVVPLIADLQTMRRREGAALAQVLCSTLDRLTEAVNGVANLRPEIEQRFQQRLTERLEAAVGPEVNRQRMLEEIAVLVERSDVSEEIARMETHIQHFRDVLTAGGETGKKLDFLLQEMNREANTLLSKTAGVAGKGTLITELGLAMKAEIEKAREQIQNLE